MDVIVKAETANESRKQKTEEEEDTANNETAAPATVVTETKE